MKPSKSNIVRRGNCVAELHYGIDARSALRSLGRFKTHCVLTAPPRWLQGQPAGEPQKWADGWVGHLGREPDPDQYATHIAEIFRLVRKVMRSDGVAWLSLTDAYMVNESSRSGKEEGEESATALLNRYPSPGEVGLRQKSLVGVPWRVAFAIQNRPKRPKSKHPGEFQSDALTLRNELVWHRPDHMPTWVKDRLLVGHETIFLFSKSRRYWFGREEAIEAGISKELRRDVWTFGSGRIKGRNHGVLPASILEPLILMGCPPGGTVLDPFAGTGSTGAVALRLGRNFIGFDVDESLLLAATQRVEGL